MATKTLPRTTLPNVADAVAVMRLAPARGRGRKSAIYLWFLKNHDALVEAFALNAPAWTELAAYLSSQGLKDGNGNPPRARGTRDVWFRVRQEVKQRPLREPPLVAPKARSGETTRGTSPMPPVSPSLPTIRPVDDEPTESPRPKVKIDFKPATFRNPSDKDN